jgi:hypothetical protein
MSKRSSGEDMGRIGVYQDDRSCGIPFTSEQIEHFHAQGFCEGTDRSILHVERGKLRRGCCIRVAVFIRLFH